uniref:Integrase catalytic domain-containing protein n=1 Tax=Trichuris muris TaxID=70415 RepID=A0A5S6QTZ0_TRIMR
MSTTPSYPIMAPLPPERLTCSSPAFVNVGIDCFGPFQVIIKRSLLKRYGCIISSFASRASHLEVLHSLDAHLFILALRRYIARRGLPSTIFSDNGGNFVAVERILHGILTSDHVLRHLADRQSEWMFMPANAPHFGGIWERLIAVAKRALMAVLQGNTVTDELLITVFAEVESPLNGRPLAYIGTDSAHPEPLTPFLLLTGRANVHAPPDVLCDLKCTIQKHWTRAVEIADRFWRRWQREYLPTLQGSSKWTSQNQDIQVDDVVLVVEPTYPRGHWPIGRVVQVFPGRNGRVRAASVRMKDGLYKRPVAKLAVLERAQDSSE